MYENVTQQPAEFTIAMKYGDLPEDVVEKTKLMLLDSIGCALGGYITDKYRIGMELIAEFGGHPQATIIGGPRTES